jgi:hypothetical protein
MLKPAGEIVSESFHLYLKNFRAFIPYLLIMFLPVLILSLLGAAFLYLEILWPASGLATNIILLILRLVEMILSLWTYIALTRALNAVFLNQSLSWKEGFKTSSRFIWPFILVSILKFLIILGGTVLLIIPGIIFSVWYKFALYPVILDGMKSMPSLQKSHILVTGRWWSVAFRLFIIGLLLLLMSVALVLLVLFISNYLPGPKFLQMMIISLLTVLFNTVIVPWSVAAYLILYHNIRENPVDSTAPPTSPATI